MRELKPGDRFRFVPCPIDKFDPRCDAKPGSVVRVTSVSDQHCEIADEKGDQSLGLVHVDSLVPIVDAGSS